MRVVGILSIILGLLSLCSYTKAEEDLYFEGSGDETTSFPTDDEDIEEASGFDFGNGRDQGDATIDSIDGVDEEPEVGGGKIRVIQPEENDERIEEPEDEKDDNFDLDKAEIDDNDDIIQDSIMAGNTHFLAAVIVGGCIGLLFAVCVIMLLVYRMRKKDEGSYALEYGLDGKKPQGSYEYTKGVDSKEYYA